MIKIKDWDKLQSLRQDRGAPPWIKVHRNLLSNEKWAQLSDAEKGQIVSMWLVAADNNGMLPDDPKIIRKICQLDDVPDINKFKELGFFEKEGCQVDAIVAPICQPVDNHDLKDGCQSGSQEESRVEKSRDKKDIPNGISKEKDFPKPESVSEQAWSDFKKLRARKKAPITQTAMDGIAREAVKAGISLEAAIVFACERGWTSFKADWIRDRGGFGSLGNQRKMDQYKELLKNGF